MAYLDIAGNSSYGRYNRKFAQIVGLEAAVYWSEILEVLDRVLEKKTFDHDGWFVLNRDYIKKRTTFSEEKQKECEEILSRIEIYQVSPDNENRVRCDVKAFVKIMIEDDIETMKEVKAIAKAATKTAKAESKKANIITMLVNSLSESPEVTEKYRQFLEVAYNKGLCQKAKLKNFVDEINQFTSDDSVKIQLLNIGIDRSYTKAEWIINAYSRNSTTKSVGAQKTATKLSDIEL